MGTDENAVRAWARRSVVDRLGVRIRAMEPGARPGTALVPFPRIDAGEYKKLVRGKRISERAEKAPVRPVPLAELTAIQRTVNLERLEQHARDPKLNRPGLRSPGHGGLVDLPIVVRQGGKSFLHDGHHRSVGALLRGERSVRARVVDLEE